MARKYSKYKIIITHTNGEKEEIKLNGINNSSYKETLKLYRDVKEEYIQISSVQTISFLGQTSTGDLEAMFTKEVNVKKKETTEEFVQANLDSSINRNLKKIHDLLQLVKAQEIYAKDLVAIGTKQRDTLLHQIEFIDNLNFKSIGDKERFKLDIFDKLKQASDKRRFGKETSDTITKLKNMCSEKQNITIDGMIGVIKPWTHDKIDDRITPEEYSEKVQKVVSYNGDKERLRLMKQFKLKYDKVVNDPIKKELYCYNNVGQGKKKNKRVI